jgi:hypothetical protein
LNKKAQLDLEPIPILLGLVGGAFAFYMAGTMGAGIVLKIMTALATAVVCYIIVNVMSR